MKSQSEPHDDGQRWQLLSCLVCVVFGCASIANIHPAGDGLWYWYATLWRQGQHLYADMHLAVQPLFVLQTAYTLTLFGNGWLVSKIPALVQLVLFLIGLRSISGFLPYRDWEKALLIAAAFFLPIFFVAYRFDDYHVLADSFEVYSIVLLLQLQGRSHTSRFRWIAMVCLGACSGLSITTRLNDGGMLFLTVLLSIVVISRENRLKLVSAFVTSCGLVVLSVVLLTGDSIRAYLTYSVFRAAGSKGGAGHVFLAPLRLPWMTIQTYARTTVYDKILIIFVVLFTLVYLLQFRRFSRDGRVSAGRVVIFGAALLAVVVKERSKLVRDLPTTSLTGAVMFFALFLGARSLIRMTRAAMGYDGRPGWSGREILVLIPLGQLLSASMSSGGHFEVLFAPIGLFLLLLPVVYPGGFNHAWQKTLLLTCVMVMLVSTIGFKIRVPYSWHTYVEPRMFSSRQWYRHPIYGPMIIEKRQLAFIEPVCEEIKAGDPTPELLSLPFPYANYFCGVRPWHDYVQTFFDTSSRQTIARLMGELESAPPRWIMYQRQPDILALHEEVFNNNKPLPQRDLDVLVMNKLGAGQWKQVSDWDSKTGAHWMLIRTR